MSIYAIAVIREQSGEVKVRLLSPDKGKCTDVAMSGLSYYINKDDGIRNLCYDKKQELKWKQGSVERYPIIDKQTSIIKNEDAVTVIGVADTGAQKFYRICNMAGQIAIIKSSDLIEYSKQHKISNCKLVRKGNTEFISAIEGEIETIDTQTKYKIDNDLNYLHIHIPFMTSDTLEIPDNVHGRPIMNIESIKITPESSANGIRKLKLGKFIKSINIGLFNNMLNLEEIYIPGTEVDIYDGAFTYLSKLRKVYFNTIRATSQNMFAGLKNLEEVNCVRPFGYIQSGSFAGCVKLDINTVLKEGVIIIGTKAFAGNSTTTNLIIPSTVTTVVDNAFEKCNNLKSVDVKTEILTIDTNTRTTSKGLFAELGPIEMYINQNTAYNKERVASNVRIMKRDASARDKTIENKVQKSNIIGISLDPTKLVRSNAEIADILIAVPQSEVTAAITKMVQEALKSNRMRYIALDHNIGGFKVRLQLTSPTGICSTKKVSNIGKFLVLRGKKVIFIPTDQFIIRDNILKSNSYEQIPTAIAESKYLKSIDVSDEGKIRLIYEVDNQVKIKYIDDFEIKK